MAGWVRDRPAASLPDGPGPRFAAPGPDACGAVPVGVPAATGVTSRTATGGRDDPARAKAEVMTTAEATAPIPAMTRPVRRPRRAAGTGAGAAGTGAGMKVGRGPESRATGRGPGTTGRGAGTGWTREFSGVTEGGGWTSAASGRPTGGGRAAVREPSSSARARGDRAGAGSRAKTRAAETLRGRASVQASQPNACSSTRSRSPGVIVPDQPASTSARSGQGWPRRASTSAPTARSRFSCARVSSACASPAGRPRT